MPMEAKPITQADHTDVPIPHIGFVINETPYCIWDANLKQSTLQFINGIDPTYFLHIAKIHGELLDGDQKQSAATAIRVAYGQSLETLFALIGALVQAPHCVVGWMLKYKNSELFALVNKINSSQAVFTRLKNKDVTWKSISDLVFQKMSTGNLEHDQKIRSKFAALWGQFADDFLNEDKKYEYNSIKHGNRAAIGGFRLAIGPQGQRGEPAPPDKMITLSHSEFGSSFSVPETLGDGRNFTLKLLQVNWSAASMLWTLQLISLSIDNILHFLKLLYEEDPHKIRFSYPMNLNDFQSPSEGNDEVVMKIGPIIRLEHITRLSTEEILEFYQ